MTLTPRLRLRAMSARDLPLFRKLYTDAQTMRHIGKPLASREVEPSFRATLAATGSARGPWFFTIIEQRRRAAIGLCSIRHFSSRQRSAEVGLMLLPTAGGRGFGSEALGTLLDIAFGALPIDTIWVQYRAANRAVARLFDSLGFSPSGGTRSQRLVRSLPHKVWRKRSDPSTRGTRMSNIIGFLELAGANAAMRHASREALLHAVQNEEIENVLRQPHRSLLDDLTGARETMYCWNQATTPSKKKKAPAKKKPAKKAPAKKAPAKRKK